MRGAFGAVDLPVPSGVTQQGVGSKSVSMVVLVVDGAEAPERRPTGGRGRPAEAAVVEVEVLVEVELGYPSGPGGGASTASGASPRSCATACAAAGCWT